MDALILAVAHEYFAGITRPQLDLLYGENAERKKILLDLKGLLNRKEYEQAGYLYWRL